MDDGSRDNFCERALEIAVSSGTPSKLIKIPQNMGPSFAKASGIANSTKEIILMLDSDDLIPEGAVQQIKNGFLLHTKADFLFGHYKKIQVESGKSTVVTCREITQPSGELDIGQLALEWSLLGSSPFRRQAAKSWAHYDLAFPITDDIDFWRQALLRGARGQHIDSLIYIWNLSSEGNYSKQSQRELSSSWLRNRNFYRQNLSIPRFFVNYLRNLAMVFLSFLISDIPTTKKNFIHRFGNLVRIRVRMSRFLFFIKRINRSRSWPYRGANDKETLATVFHHFTKEVQRGETLEPAVWINSRQFEKFVTTSLRKGSEFLSLDDSVSRTTSGYLQGDTARSICITIDDGYQSFVELGLPVLEKYGIPFTVFVCGGFAEDLVTPWWESLEGVISANDKILFLGRSFSSHSLREKRFAFNDLKDHFLSQDIRGIRLALETFLEENKIDKGMTGPSFLDVDELIELSQNPLCTLADHSYSHLDFTQQPVGVLTKDIARNRDFFNRAGLSTPRHFAFPFGVADNSLLQEVSRMGYESISVSSNLCLTQRETVDLSRIVKRVNIQGFTKWSPS